MLRLSLLLLLMSLLVAPGCQSSEEAAADPEDIVSGVGTVVYVDLEGGFYGIEADDGATYNPLSLDEALQEDGLRVRFRGVVRDDVMTIQMWGQPLELLEIMTL